MSFTTRTKAIFARCCKMDPNVLENSIAIGSIFYCGTMAASPVYRLLYFKAQGKHRQ